MTKRGGVIEGVVPVRTVLREPAAPVHYEPPGLGRLRKIALVGTASTVALTPWFDPSWEIWAHSSAGPVCHRVDRFFDLHNAQTWRAPKRWNRNYQKWLQTLPVPIYMQRHYAEIPQSIRYPRERVLSEFRRYFNSQVAWMIALALTEGVTHLGFFGIHYAASFERGWQRNNCEYWMGMAEGRGVQLVIPQGCPMLQSSRLYGYESHDLQGNNLMIPKPKRGGMPDLAIIDMDSPVGRPPLMELPNGQEPNWARSGHRFHC